MLALLAVLVGGALVGAVFPSGLDWYGTYRPAVRSVFSGQSPYHDSPFYGPPWITVPLLPLAVLPAEWGRGAIFVACLLTYAAAAVRLGARWPALILLLTSPVVLHELLNANVDWLVLLALFVPVRWGVFFALMKPQVGIGLLVWWAFEAWREGGWRSVVMLLWPVAAVTVLSFALYGLWPLRTQQLSTYQFSASLFPYSVPFGLGLLWIAVRQRTVRPALAASPMLAPYTLFHSWIGMLIALSHRPKWLAVAVGGLWLLVGIIAVRLY